MLVVDLVGFTQEDSVLSIEDLNMRSIKHPKSPQSINIKGIGWFVDFETFHIPLLKNEEK